MSKSHWMDGVVRTRLMPAISGESSVSLLCAAFRCCSNHFSYVFGGRWPVETAHKVSRPPLCQLAFITLQRVVIPNLQLPNLLLRLFLQLLYLLFECFFFSLRFRNIGGADFVQFALPKDVTLFAQFCPICTALWFIETKPFSPLHQLGRVVLFYFAFLALKALHDSRIFIDWVMEA